MALSTYDELRTEIANWLMRPDLEAAIPSFIRLVEAQLNRTLRTQDQVRRAQATLITDYTSLPADWAEAWNIQIAGGDPLQYLPPHEMDRQRSIRRQRGCPATGAPESYSIIGRNIEVLPSPQAESTVVEMVYFAEVEALGSETPANWVLRRHPDLYLYGALLHSAPYLVDDGRLAIWQSQFDRAMSQVSESEARSRRSGAPLKRPN